MRKKIILLLLALFLLALGIPASAENRAGAVTLSPFVGGYKFECFQELDENWYYGLRAGYNLTGHWGLELMGGYVPTESNARGYDGEDVDVFRYGGDVLYNLMPEKKFVPFLAVGFGGISIDDPSGLNDKDRAMLDYGVGFKYFITQSVALRADVRQDLFCELSDACSNLEYTGGLTILIGGKKKAVAEAAPPAEASAPAPAPIVIVEEAAPAPIPVPIVLTECSTSPKNGATNVSVAKKVTAKFSGPMPKGSFVVTAPDKTAVKGAIIYDLKTNTATFLSDVPFEPDTTYTATIVNTGEQIDDPMNSNCVWSFTTAPVVLIELDDSHFAHDSSALTTEGNVILDKNVRILKANPKLHFLVAGYASSSGTEEYNQKLSERRATAVRDYFIKEGIAPERLEKIGYGENRPAIYEVDSSDIESRAAQSNRRVIFTIIVK